jgi:hypothetical protein
MSGISRNCVLHIGTEKTGTTTLQAFLDINREALREQGFLYTESAGKQNNRLMSLAAFDAQRRDDFTVLHQVGTDAELQVLQAQVIARVKAEIENSSCPTTVFSSEHFHSRLGRPSEIARLKEVLSSLGFEKISVVVYLRRPADLACSLFSTAVRTGNQMLEPPDPTNPYWNLICNHRNTLLKWGEVFGSENLVPRLFIRQEMVGAHIVDDFLHVLGIAKGAMQVPEDQNEALSAAGLQILQRLNRTVPTVHNGKTNPMRRNLVSFVERHFSTPKYEMPVELVKAYDEAYADSDEWVRENFFPHRERLFVYGATAPSVGGDEASTRSNMDAMIDMFSDVWIEKHRRIIHLEKKIKEM